ncbi:hypothetical protein NDU88_005677 [Pleurodeles waltl]|uniref:Uncharacterized protein n=1 Tax=Pleurodeles waltl TaxID=8319 RepID=A0AAV7QFG3_PLEWA|nr:hypothetical protein NDU88_005677 [Pleurodeles waltl]
MCGGRAGGAAQASNVVEDRDVRFAVPEVSVLVGANAALMAAQAQQRTLDAPEKRCCDSGDRRDGQSLRRAAWPHEEPDSVAPVPRKEEELKRGQNPHAG